MSGIIIAVLLVVGLVGITILPFLLYLYRLNKRQDERFQRYAEYFDLDERTYSAKALVRGWPQVKGNRKGEIIVAKASRTGTSFRVVGGRFKAPVTRFFVYVAEPDFAHLKLGNKETLAPHKPYLLMINGKEAAFPDTEIESLITEYISRFGRFEIESDDRQILRSFIPGEMSNDERYHQSVELTQLMLAVGHAFSKVPIAASAES